MPSQDHKNAAAFKEQKADSTTALSTVPLTPPPLEPIPLAETYFSIPDDLETLESMSAVEYLRQHVWLSYARQKKCKEVFLNLTKCNTEMKLGVANAEQVNIDEVLLPSVFLGVALVDLFRIELTHDDIDGLMNYLDIIDLKSHDVDFRTWCGISALAERLLYRGPLEFEKLEKADFKNLKRYGDLYDIPPDLRIVFDSILDMHKWDELMVIL